MKKSISILLILVLIMSVSFSAYAAEGTNTGGVNLQEVIHKLLSNTTQAINNVAKKFTDMGSHWADNTVGKLVELGILAGYEDGTFKPDNTITRGEFTKVVRTSLKMPIVEGNAFDDTKNHWAKNEINTLVVNKAIVKSEYGTNYQPNKNITRVEMAKMIVRALGLDDKAKAQVNATTPFKDNGEIKSEDRGYILIASQNKIINGYPDQTFKPDGEATRAEASQMIVNMYEAIDKGIDIGEETPTVPQNPQPPVSVEIDKKLKDARYIQTENLRIDENGQIYIEKGNKEYKVESKYDTMINTKVLNLLNDLVDENHYVSVGYDEGRNGVIIQYKMNNTGNTVHFSLCISLNPFDVSNYGEGFSKETNGYINIERLFGSQFEGSFVVSHYAEKLRKSIIDILGEKDGEKAYDYMIGEFKNKTKGLPKDMSNLESYKGKTEVKQLENSTLYMFNDDFFNTPEMYFYYTND